MNIIILADDKGKLTTYGFQPVYVNAGGTRTRTFSGWTSVKYFDGSVPNNIDLSKPFDKVETVDTVLGAGAPSTFAPVTLTGDEADKIIAKSGVGLLWGHIQFTDIFDPTIEHGSSICFVLQGAQATNGKTVLQPIPYKNDCNKSY